MHNRVQQALVSCLYWRIGKGSNSGLPEDILTQLPCCDAIQASHYCRSGKLKSSSDTSQFA